VHLRSSGFRHSTPGALAPVRVICAPLAGTSRFHRHGLYEMPSRCVTPQRLGDPRVVPCFRWLFSVGMSPSETPGSRSVAYTQFLHRPRWPSTLWTVSALPSPSTLRFSWRSPFRGLTTVRLRYNLPTCSPPVGADHAFAQPTGTFTSGLPPDWSPAPPPDMTTVATGQVPLTGLTTLHPLEHQLASLQPIMGLLDNLREGGLADRLLLKITYGMAIYL
jgi:hypothetical protein